MRDHSSIPRAILLAACLVAAAACGENGPGFWARGVLTVSPAGSMCHFRWQGFVSDSTTRVDVSLLEMYADFQPALVPIDSVLQYAFHGHADIGWDGPGRSSPAEITGVHWSLWKDGTTLIPGYTTAPVHGWPTCSSP
jgi:hypothetical protein